MSENWNGQPDKPRVVDNPLLGAVKASGVAQHFAGLPITDTLLAEVSALLSKATRAECTAFHEVGLVPPGNLMVRVRVRRTAGGPCVLTAFRAPAARKDPSQ